jgi:hypothetical protein
LNILPSSIGLGIAFWLYAQVLRMEFGRWVFSMGSLDYLNGNLGSMYHPCKTFFLCLVGFFLALAGRADGVDSSTFDFFKITPNATNSVVRVKSALAQSGTDIDVIIELVAQGSENGISFSLGFDPKLLTYVEANFVATNFNNGSLIDNTEFAFNGVVGILAAAPIGRSIPAGIYEVFRITFTAKAGVDIQTPVRFVSSPIPQKVVSVTAQTMPSVFQDGMVTLQSLPVITGFSPAEGSVGTKVVISGAHFTGATSVKFNTTYATVFTVDSATNITATVPTGATTGPISITTVIGACQSSTLFTVTLPSTRLGIALVGGKSQLSVTGTIGGFLQVQWTEDLKVWTDGEIIRLSTSPQTWTDTQTHLSKQRFYRMIVF